MRCSRSGGRIIGIGALLAAVLLWLGGCTALRFTYNQGPEIAYWWMDGYVDFDDEQEARMRRRLHDWFDWHRRTQLPDYAGLLARAESEAAADAAPAQICAWVELLRDRGERLYEQAVPMLAELAVTVGPAQIEHLERKYAKNNREFAREYLQDSAQERREAVLKRASERAEMLYGSLAEPQRERLRKGVAESPFDPALWFEERKARQQAVLALLKRHGGRPESRAEAEAGLRRLGADVRRSPRDAYRRYEHRLVEYNCALAADVHNVAPPAQREAALRKLKGWETDVRRLAAQAQP